MERFWRKSLEPSNSELRALLNRARVISVDMVADPDGGVTGILLELHHEGEPTRMLRLSAHGLHTEGWLYGEARNA